MQNGTIPLTEDSVKEYLDDNIKHWHRKRNNPKTRKRQRRMCDYYVDTLQSVRISLFGETAKVA